MQQVTGKAVARSTRVRVAAIILGLIIAFHFTATCLWVAPGGPLNHTLAPVVKPYMQPFFQQGWYLFAPNPARADFSMLVRARWIDRATGKARTSDWVNVTAREWRNVLHNPLHSRSATQGNQLHNILSTDRVNLSDNQAAVCQRDYSHSGWDQLRADLTALSGTNSSQLDSYILHERVAAAFATQYAYARWSQEVQAVQFLFHEEPVPAPAFVHNSADKESAGTIAYGWRPPVVFPGQSRGAFSQTIRRAD